MNILWINPYFLPLLSLAVVPVIIHLFAKAKPRLRPFSSLRFIRPLVRRQSRIKRPREWLLLFLRTLAVLLLVAAFARPRWFQGFLPAPGQPRTVVLVIDATASMQAAAAGQTRFAAASAQADRLLDGLRARDRANIVWIHRSPSAIFPAPGVNLAHLRQALRRTRAGYEAGDIAGAIQTAVEQLADVEGDGELIILSDFQASSWRGVLPELPSELNVSLVPVGSPDDSNLALRNLTLDPSSPTVGEAVSVSCEVRNFGSARRRVTVELGYSGTRLRQDLVLAPDEVRKASFRCRFGRAGTQMLSCRIDHDRFPADDRITAAVPVRETVSAVLLARDDTRREAWERLLQSHPRLRLRPSESMPSPGEAHLLVLADWDGRDARAAQRFLLEGGLVLWNPAGCPPEAVAALAGIPPPPDSVEVISAAPGRSVRIRNANADVLQLFRAGEHGDLGAPTFHRFADIIPEVLPAAETVLTFPPLGHCALAQLPRGRGRLVVWNMPLRQEDSNFLQHGDVLVQLSGEILRLWRPAAGGRREEWPGARLTHDLKGTAAQGLQLADEQGETVAHSIRPTPGGATAVSEPVPQPGFYHWQQGGDMLATTAVNLNPVESDLRSLDHDQLSSRADRRARIASADLRWRRDGRPLWPWLLAFAALVLAVEASVLWFAAKRQALIGSNSGSAANQSSQSIRTAHAKP
ncbi:MAG: vWA domain-containing protein [Verrucomicrobiota bacterium]